MRSEEKGEFTKLLAATMDVYGRQITTAFVDIFFSALGQYDLPTVREALNRHIQDSEAGRFAPKPADLIRQIVTAKSSDGRPGRDEAWAIAQNALDEAKTVVVTEEILGALEIARPLIEIRDKVAARMAFIEAYDRLVAEKRAKAAPMEWQVSLGTDKHQRVAAIESAAVRGLLPGPRAKLLIAENTETPISAEGLAIAGLLTGGNASSPDELRERWRSLRAKVATSAKEDRAERHRRLMEAERELIERKTSEEQNDEQE